MFPPPTNAMSNRPWTPMWSSTSLLGKDPGRCATFSVGAKLSENDAKMITLQGTNISPTKALLKMIFLFPRWDMLVPWRVNFENCHVPWKIVFGRRSPFLLKWPLFTGTCSFFGGVDPFFSPSSSWTLENWGVDRNGNLWGFLLFPTNK